MGHLHAGLAMTGYPRANHGDPPFDSNAFSARWQNDVTEMVNWFKRAKASGEILPGSGPLESTSGLVKIQNLVNTAEDPEVDDPVPVDLVRGNYVQLGDYLLDDVDHRKHWFEGKLYDSEQHGQIAILLKASKGALNDDETEVAGDIQRARTLGVCTALVNVTDITHRFAAPEDDEYVLKSATSGPVQIFGTSQIDGTGVQELTVQLGSGSGGSDSDIHEGVVVNEVSARVDGDEYGEGEVSEDVADGGPPNIPIKNIFYETILVGTPVWFIYRGDDAYVLVPGC